MIKIIIKYFLIIRIVQFYCMMRIIRKDDFEFRSILL